MYRNHAPRHPSDDYQTPYKLAREAALRLAALIPAPKHVVEPSAGIGAFVRASLDAWPTARITAVELREECKETLEGILASSPQSRIEVGTWEGCTLKDDPADLVLGNPPYEYALQHLNLALHRTRDDGYVAMLLRMAFLSTQKRVRTFWDKKPGFRYLIPLAQRVSFTGDGKNEHSEHALMVFKKGYTGMAEILPHLWIPEDEEDAEEVAPEAEAVEQQASESGKE